MVKNTKSGLNGSVDLLANALRKVFTEAVTGAVEPLRDDMNKGFNETGKQLTQITNRLDSHQKALDGLKNKTSQKKKGAAQSARR